MAYPNLPAGEGAPGSGVPRPEPEASLAAPSISHFSPLFNQTYHNPKAGSQVPFGQIRR